MDRIFDYREEFIKYNDAMETWKASDRSILLDAEDPFYEVFKRTLYIKYDQMLTGIRNSIALLDPMKQYQLFFPLKYPFKMGSENAIILDCWDSLNQLNIVNVITAPPDILMPEEPEQEINILIIDDGLYTGKHLCYIIQHLEDRFGGFNVCFDVIVYSSHNSIESKLRNKIMSPINFSSSVIPSTLNQIVFELNPNCEKEHVISAIGGYDEFPAIYFDHKIHDSIVNLYPKEIFQSYPCRFPADCVHKIYQNNYSTYFADFMADIVEM